MASDTSSNNSGIVAIFAIVLMVLIAGFLAYQTGFIGGHGGGGGGSTHHGIDVNVK